MLRGLGTFVKCKKCVNVWYTQNFGNDILKLELNLNERVVAVAKLMIHNIGTFLKEFVSSNLNFVLYFYSRSLILTDDCDHCNDM